MAKKAKIKNCYWFRHFLLANRIAQVTCKSGGRAKDGKGANFAAYILDEEENGTDGNSQMTDFFWAADVAVSEMTNSNSGDVFDSLDDEEDISLETIAALTGDELKSYFAEYIIETGGNLIY